MGQDQVSRGVIVYYYVNFSFIEQDKTSDIEQQPAFGDRKSNTQPQNRGGVTKPTGTSYNFNQV